MYRIYFWNFNSFLGINVLAIDVAILPTWWDWGRGISTSITSFTYIVAYMVEIRVVIFFFVIDNNNNDSFWWCGTWSWAHVPNISQITCSNNTFMQSMLNHFIIAIFAMRIVTITKQFSKRIVARKIVQFL